MLAQLEAGERRVSGLDTDTDETFETELTRRDNPLRAYITIIEGCDKACTYCVVPYTRGPERSRASAAVLQEARQLAEVGYTEVQLLGQTVNSYRDPSTRGMSFAELLVAVSEVPGIRRVRFMTSHPRDLGADIVAAMDSVPAICEHLHLPVQSGSTRILRSHAARLHARGISRKTGAGSQRAPPDQHHHRYDRGLPRRDRRGLRRNAQLARSGPVRRRVFAFSTRRGRIPRRAPCPTRSRRKKRAGGCAILQERQRAIQSSRNQALVGTVLEVFVEGAARRENQWAGRTSSNRMVNITSPRLSLLGEYVSVRITGAGPNSLVGEHLISA